MAIGCNVHTRKLLDQKEKTLVSFSLAGNYNELSGETQPKASFLSSWKNDENTFGMLASVGYQGSDVRGDLTVVQGWRERSLTLNDGRRYNGVLTPVNIRSQLLQQYRERTASMLTVQFRPTENLELSLDRFYSEVSGNNRFNHFQFIPGINRVQEVTIDSDLNTAIAGRFVRPDLRMSCDGGF